MSDLISGTPRADISVSDETFRQILDLIANGKSLRQICAMPGMPNKATIFRRARKDTEFALEYAVARDMQADAIADDALYEATHATDYYLGRLAFDARRWYAGKVAAKKWGAKSHETADEGSDEMKNEPAGPV